MKTITRAEKYLEVFANGSELGVWHIMNKARKKYARYLVENYGYSTHMAIQCSYIHGFDSWAYDYRKKCPVRETRTRASFGF